MPNKTSHSSRVARRPLLLPTQEAPRRVFYLRGECCLRRRAQLHDRSQVYMHVRAKQERNRQHEREWRKYSRRARQPASLSASSPRFSDGHENGKQQHQAVWHVLTAADWYSVGRIDRHVRLLWTPNRAWTPLAHRRPATVAIVQLCLRHFECSFGYTARVAHRLRRGKQEWQAVCIRVHTADELLWWLFSRQPSTLHPCSPLASQGLGGGRRQPEPRQQARF